MATITETGTIDLKAQKEAHDEASQVATNYITPNGTSEAAFHPEASSTNQVKVDGTGVDIIKSGTSVAKYGDIARIGVENQSHLELSAYRMRITGANANESERFDINNMGQYSSDPFDIAGGAISSGLTASISGGFLQVTPVALSVGSPLRTDENEATLVVGLDKVRIGKANTSNIVLDYHSLQLLDSSQESYLYVSDLVSDDGFITIDEAAFFDVPSVTINLNYIVSSMVSITIGNAAYEYEPNGPGSTTTHYSFTNGSDGGIITLNDLTAIGLVIIRYTVQSDQIDNAKAFTFGNRSNEYFPGPYSYAAGIGLIASGSTSCAIGEYNSAFGRTSYASGYNSSANGDYSHADGYYARAIGKHSYAIGNETTAEGLSTYVEGANTSARGQYTHAQNLGTRAYGVGQTAIGKYNKQDTSGTQAFIIGNGTSNSARSNAFTVDWDGNTNAMGLLKLRTPLINRDGTAPSSTVYDNLHCVEFTDADNENIGRVRMHQDKNGRIGITMQCRNEKTDGTEVINEISASVAKDGTKTYGLSDPAAFCSAISALPRSGGIVTGPVYVKNTVIDRSVNPSSAQYSTDVGGDSSFRLVDKNNAMLAYLRISKQTDGRTGLDIRVWNSDTSGNNAVSGNFHMLINRSGTVTYAMTNPENFRNAIGASSGIFPRSVGGTGMSARTTGTVTRSGLSTDGTINVYSNGVTCTLAASNVKLKAALANSSTVQLATLPAGYRPPMNVFTNISSPAQSPNGRAWVRVDSSGVVTLGNYSGAQFTTSTQLYFTITWAL